MSSNLLINSERDQRLNNPKVFEFAKEVGMTPLALMDKIREWQLPVKSHMAELDPETLALLKQKMQGGSGDDTEKKTVAKKKAPAAKNRCKNGCDQSGRQSKKSRHRDS